jgi:hypothetical protein
MITRTFTVYMLVAMVAVVGAEALQAASNALGHF